MYNQVKQLQESGIEAHVVCERTENLEQFHVANIHSLENEPFPRKTWEECLRRLKIRRHLGYLVEKSKEVNANIVHSHFGPIAWENLGAVRKLKAKHVVTFYGFDVNMLPVQEPKWRKRYLQLFSEVDLVLCEGSHMARCIVELGCPEHKVKVQHLGVDVNSIVFKPRQCLPNEPLQVLIAASFREKKGIPYAIKALQVVAHKVPVALTIIGDAGADPESQKEKTNILKALENSGLKGQTRLLGYQSHRAMLREAYDHHIFLQPSVTASNGDTEGGAPVAIIEMMASGMLVVATDHCDIPEVIGPENRHLLAPERDEKELAKCIMKLSDTPETWLEQMEKARMHVESNYSLQRQCEHLIGHYNDLL